MVFMFIETRKKKGIEYFYLRENKSVNGKSICVFQKYIGNKQKLIDVIQNGLDIEGKPIVCPDETVCFNFGAVATLYKISQKIDIFPIIDSIVKKRRQGMPVSTYLLVASINRVIRAKSKRATSGWVSKTSLPNLITNIELEKLTSQSFWDNMNLISDKHIRQIEDEITKRTIELYNLKPKALLYDTSNYFSFIHTFNNRCTVEQRGKNKQHRYDLRQSNFALMVTEDDHVPLYHRVYNGNENDYTSFKQSILDMKAKRDSLFNNNQDITLVFDAGNVSKDNMELVSKYNFKYISKLKPSDHVDLLKVDLSEYTMQKLDTTNDNEKTRWVKLYKTRKKIYESEKHVVIKYNPVFFEAERITVYKHISEIKTKFAELESRLNKYFITNKLPSTVKKTSVENNINSILKGRTYLKKVVKYSITIKNKNFPILEWSISPKDIESYCNTYLGKTLYFTNRSDLSSAEIMKIYSYQIKIEDLFKISKDRDGGCWWPKFHWTDQKIKVHGLYCFISLLLLSLLKKELSTLKINNEIHDIVEEMHEISEIVDKYKNKKGKTHILKRHSKLTEKQNIIFNHFNLQEYLV